jgi:2-dehydro-3-deoxygalactonokinase
MSKFISCDWGTSNLRLRLVDSDKSIVLKEIKTGEGIASVYKLWKARENDSDRTQFYLSFLQKQIGIWQDEMGSWLKDTPVLISGMASSSIGLTELEYKTLPVQANGSDLFVEAIKSSQTFSNPVYIVSGLCTEDDVMRGEETLLAGCNTLATKIELFIFPGTHSKHILVNDGSAESFTTYMTGEFFDLLSRQSILSSSVSEKAEFYAASFREGIIEGTSKNLLNTSFKVRVNHLFRKTDPGENFDYLSGLLIGCELGEIKADHFELITIVASGDMAVKYMHGLQVLGLSYKTRSIDTSEAIVKGHSKIFSSLQKFSSGNL